MNDHYCTHCASEDLAAGELYANGREWTCKRCGNVFLHDDPSDDDERAAAAIGEKA